jgi:hypothetical protein
MPSIRTVATALAFVALTVQATVARVDVKVDFDKTFNFKTLKTWGWSAAGPGEVKMARTQTDNPESMQKVAEPLIVETITSEMTRLGMQAAPASPDMTVTYYLLLSTSQTAQSMGQFVPATMSWGLPLFPQATQSLKVMNQGSLVLDLSAKGNVVWRGVAQAEIKMDMERKRREEMLREGVRDLLKRYPPKQP